MASPAMLTSCLASPDDLMVILMSDIVEEEGKWRRMNRCDTVGVWALQLIWNVLEVVFGLC